jgi:hypothetical protein
MLRKYAKWLLHYPWLIVMFSLAVTFVAGQGIPYTQFKNDSRLFMGHQTPQVIGFNALQKTIGVDNILLMLSPKNGDVFTAQNIAIAKNLTENLQQTPYAARVDSLTNFFTPTDSASPTAIDKLIQKASQLNTFELAQIKQVSLTEPVLVHRLVSSDSKTLGFNIIFQFTDGMSSDEKIEKAANFVRKLANDLTAVNPDMVIQLSGSIMMQKAFTESSELSLKSLSSPTMLVIVAAALWVFLRSFVIMIAAMTVVTSSIIITAGLTGWLNLTFSAASLSILYLLIAITVADTAHIFTSYKHAINCGLPKSSAIQKSLIDNFTAIFISHFATGTGFLTLSFNAPATLQDLGNIAAMGVAVTFVLVIAFFPALIYLLPISDNTNGVIWTKPYTVLTNFINKIRSPFSVAFFVVTFVLVGMSFK